MVVVVVLLLLVLVLALVLVLETIITIIIMIIIIIILRFVSLTPALILPSARALLHNSARLRAPLFTPTGGPPRGCCRG